MGNTETRLKAEESIMDAACEYCKWPALYDDEDQMLEERCESCPVALAVAAVLDLCEKDRCVNFLPGQGCADIRVLWEHKDERILAAAEIPENLWRLPAAERRYIAARVRDALTASRRVKR